MWMPERSVTFDVAAVDQPITYIGFLVLIHPVLEIIGHAIENIVALSAHESDYPKNQYKDQSKDNCVLCETLTVLA